MPDSGSSLIGCRLFVTGEREREFLAVIIGILILGCIHVVTSSACLCSSTFG